MKLISGQKAPRFITTDIWGQEVDLYNTKQDQVLLSFFRYADCPLCNMQISNIMRHRDELVKNNIHVIAVFESSVESLKTGIADRHHFDFTLIADPKRQLYNLYGVNPSWLKTLFTLQLSGIRKLAKAFKSGYRPSLNVEGKVNQIPADFLLNKNQLIEIAHYGTDTTDHLSFNEIF